MHRMKYGPDASLARYMGVLLARYLGERLSRLGLHAVVPVPLHRLRLRERGFNQAANMGKAVAKSLGVELETDILLRVRATPAQVGLSRSQRIDNVKGAFGVSSSNRARKRNLLLVDDVYTTGATLAEAARALLRAGAREVHVLTFARVP
ncbi:MAG: ComF family protein [Thermodesulfobacteriota bacterium]